MKGKPIPNFIRIRGWNAAMLPAALAMWFLAAAPEPPSGAYGQPVAVMPFKNLNDDAGQAKRRYHPELCE